ncbi:DJ-1/PfpI family protein [Gemmatimonas sp.]|uniref:DJ-1/PfpI family protein n=1 Tax=Gemmatimonas sp. TaxID=1962908 RepID=UPI0022CA4BF8|nr:DJ-1/PfpI family protein [Gemmatimonas sp.]MCZ8205840.1 DJ-1/PfpI family protein [Gemmatimonas sp.]
MDKLNVGILIYDNVDVLDLAGPFEVFSRVRLVPGMKSREDSESAPFNPFTIAKTSDPVALTGRFMVMPNYTFASAPKIDILLVIGGLGAIAKAKDQETIEWIARMAGQASHTLSVCTGAILLTAAGLTKGGRRITTHWAAFDYLAAMDPTLTVDREVRLVDHGAMKHSGGIACGIDLAFHLVEELYGKDVADETAHFIEYHRNPITPR